jgi:hypothetical protein
MSIFFGNSVQQNKEVSLLLWWKVDESDKFECDGFHSELEVVILPAILEVMEIKCLYMKYN